MINELEIFYSTLLFVVALIAIAVAVVVWRRRDAPGSVALALFLLATAWWSGTYALFWQDLPPSRAFWLDATYFGPVVVAPTFLIFVLQFTHRDKWLQRPLLIFLFTIPLLTILLLWTDPWHGLFYGGQRDPDASRIFSGGPWFWVNILFAYTLNLWATWLLFKTFLARRGLYRGQITLVLLAALIPWAANFVTLLHVDLLPGLDPTPVAFALTGSIIALGLFRYRFLDIVPIARDVLIETMADGILVLDNRGRVVDANPALAKLLGKPPASLIGQEVTQLLPYWSQLDTAVYDNPLGQEIQTAVAPPQYLNVRLLRLTSGHDRAPGTLILLHDTTKRKELELEREELIATLQTTLGQIKTLRGLLPICASCKKIRDDQGYWQDVAVYVRNHTEAEFSHGMCPECAHQFYGDYIKGGQKGEPGGDGS